MVSVAVVAPDMFPPSVRLVVPFLHWYVNPVPVAVTLKLTELPEQIVCVVAGCPVIATAWLTTNAAWLDVTDPHGAAPLTTTL